MPNRNTVDMKLTIGKQTINLPCTITGLNSAMFSTPEKNTIPGEDQHRYYPIIRDTVIYFSVHVQRGADGKWSTINGVPPHFTRFDRKEATKFQQETILNALFDGIDKFFEENKNELAFADYINLKERYAEIDSRLNQIADEEERLTAEMRMTGAAMDIHEKQLPANILARLEGDGSENYPPLSWVENFLDRPCVAYGMQCPGHGALIVGVVGMLGTLETRWNGRPIELRAVDGKPDADEDFGEPILLK